MSDPREFFGGPLDGMLMAVPPDKKGDQRAEYKVRTVERADPAADPNAPVEFDVHLYHLEVLGLRYEYVGVERSSTQ